MTNAKISPRDGWQIFSAIRLHFDGRFDCFKYNFQVGGRGNAAFEARPDRYFYEKFVKKYPTKVEACWYSCANVLDGKKWIGDTTDDALINLNKRLEALTYTFKQELELLAEDLAQFDKCLMNFEQNGEPPKALDLYANGTISLETITILQILTNFVTHATPKIKDPLNQWSDYQLMIEKYAPFLKTRIDRDKYRDIILKRYGLK